MEIGGLQRVSLIEYPHRICAVIFTRGCNFRCPYCHNPELVDPNLYASLIPEGEVYSFLEKRRGKLDAVTITGGEPTLQADLARAVRRMKDMGYRVKVDTNGSRPDIVEELTRDHLVDYIAMDIKGPLHKYRSLAGVDISVSDIRRSIETIAASGIEYEFRTTVARSMLTERDLNEIGKLIRGARLYVLQRFVPAKVLDQRFLSQTTFTEEEFTAVRRKLEKRISRVAVR